MQRESIFPVPSLAAAAVAGAVTAMMGFATVATYSQPRYVVSQKGREFTPHSIVIARGETVEIVNDDFDLRHHLYVDTRKFSFDSGDQEPGTKTNITFPVVGTFDVLCAIHPKMRLEITVR